MKFGLCVVGCGQYAQTFAQGIQAILGEIDLYFASKAMLCWAQQRGVKRHFIDPGKPTQNAYIESFNGKFRDECLNQNWFSDLQEARRMIEEWRRDYNRARPHSSLGYLTPETFRQKHELSLSVV